MKRLLLALGLCLFNTFALGQTIQYPPTSGITKASTAVLASLLVVKTAPAYLYAINVSADSTLSGAAWWVYVFDATILPGNGTVTPAKCYAQASGVTTFSLQ